MALDGLKRRYKRVFSGIENGVSSSTKIQFMSDLHLEFIKHYLDFEIPQKAPYLILAGDTGRLTQIEQFAAFLAHQIGRFDRVFLVLGNHEFYGLSREQGLANVDALAETLGPRLVILNRTRFDMPGRDVTILGCTLHSHIPDAARDAVRAKVADFRHIDAWTVDDHNGEHFKDLAWLRSEVSSIRRGGTGRKVIVVTHFAPTVERTSAPRHRDSDCNSAFSTELLRSQVKTWEGVENVKIWVFGHTHWSADFKSSHIRVVSNQRGYVFDAMPGQRATPTGVVRPNKAQIEGETSFDVTKTLTI